MRSGNSNNNNFLLKLGFVPQVVAESITLVGIAFLLNPALLQIKKLKIFNLIEIETYDLFLRYPISSSFDYIVNLISSFIFVLICMILSYIYKTKILQD